MMSLTINKKINLQPLAACGGLCLKLMKELGARLEVTNQTIVLIEDAKISDHQTQLYFIGELFIPPDKKPETIKKYLQILHKAYTSLLTQNQPLDFSIYNLYLVQDQLKVLDVGCFSKNYINAPVHQLAMLILKLFLTRQQYKPLKYMNNDEQINYVRKLNDFDILIPLLEESHKRISWENLAFYFQQNKSEPYLQTLQPTQSLNSYNLTFQRIQSNIRSRSRRNFGSLYEQNKSNESTSNCSKTITNLRPNSIQVTPMNKKTEGHYRPSPQNTQQQFKTEISYQTLQPPVYDNFFNKTQSVSPQDTTTNASTLQQFQEKSQAQHEKIVFKVPKSIRFKDDKEFENYLAKYKHYLECLNFVGKTVAKCISVLDAKNNLWMMPLFIVFKRMYQLRKQFQEIMKKNQNIFSIKNFFDFLEYNQYIQFQTELISQNDIVKNEVQTLLQNCELKLDKLDQRNQKKIQPLLNLDVNQNLKELSFVYLYQQIYAQLKKMMVERPKQAQELRDLIIRTQCSLLILDQCIEQFVFDMSEYNNRRLEEMYRQENDQKLEIIKQRIQKNGYQIFN